ncbi:MAG TPA: glycoside hydrolase family 2 [Bacteroidales bacterium]|nr:glycoside hydrolase family 2 [Bacteroidales bacterium]HBZ20301.1 glycoside hydrolase family 2 [Bacteroidales bacterium]
MEKKKYSISALKMSTALILMALMSFGFSSCSSEPEANTKSVAESFDNDWRFLKDSLAGAENPGFDDSNWRTLSVPHDWSIEDLPGQNGEDIIGPFSKASVDKMSSGYTVGGTGWYRKSFTTKEEDNGKIAFLSFDGVYMNADVWLNGKHLGFHPNGYTPFSYDITSILNPAGQSNIVAVRVNNEGLNSRWYSGSGIVRHVWLSLLDPVHIDISGGVYITTPEASENSADVNVVTTLINSGTKDENIVLRTDLIDPSGKVAATATDNSKLASGQTMELTQKIPVKKPSMWSIDYPNLYSAKVTVLIDDKTVDYQTSSFGIRSIRIDSQNGLTINGHPVDLIGGCYHHDNGPLGAASFDRAEERKIEVLKNNGFNAIRTSHNPPSPALLDACDRLGMVVIDEIFDMWENPKKEKDYHLNFTEWWQKDVESWIKRDRNHPSVVFWSIGNEIREAADTSGYRIATNLTSEVRKFDPTRALTEAMLGMGGGSAPGRSRWDDFETHLELLDVVGYNYAYSRYETDHEKYPNRVMMGTETNPPFALENYELVKKLPYVIGYFVWTATDNIGEAGVGMPQLRDTGEVDIQRFPNAPNGQRRPGQQGAPAQNFNGPPADMPGMPGTPGAPGAPRTQGAGPAGPPAGIPGGGFFRRDTWPVYTNYQGDIDLIGNRKVPSYYQYVVWGKSKVELFVHRPIPGGKREVTSRWGFPDELKSWNWEGQEGKKLQVHVYTRSQQVKLELNGKVVGEQNVDPEKSITATFEVPYEPGKLVAHCLDNGKETASQILETTGKPAAIRLVADRTKIRADRNDLSYVRAEIVDSNGNIVPDADNIVVNFVVAGNGKVAGVGSGNPKDMSSFQQPRKKAYQGICLAIIRPEITPGKISVKATADGLKDADIIITAR